MEGQPDDATQQKSGGVSFATGEDAPLAARGEQAPLPFPFFLLAMLAGGAVLAVCYILWSFDDELFKTISRSSLLFTLILAFVYYLVHGLGGLHAGKPAGEAATVAWIMIVYSLFLFINLLVVSDVLVGHIFHPDLRRWEIMYVDYAGYLILALSFLIVDVLIIVFNKGKEVLETELVYAVDIPALAGFGLILIMLLCTRMKSNPELIIVGTTFIAGAHVFQLVAANATFIGLIMLNRRRIRRAP